MSTYLFLSICGVFCIKFCFFMWYLCAYKDTSADIRLLLCESVIALVTGVCWCAMHAGSFPMEHIHLTPDGALSCLSDSDPTLLIPGSRDAPYLWLCSEFQQPPLMPVDLDLWLRSGLGSSPYLCLVTILTETTRTEYYLSFIFVILA